MENNNRPARVSPVTIIMCVLLAAAVIGAGVVFLPDYVRYNNALDCISRSEYDEAREILASLGDYLDCAEKADYCDYCQAAELLEGGEYIAAAELFLSLGEYKDSAEMEQECRYRYARQLLESGDLDGALSRLGELGTYKDSYTLMLSLLSGSAENVSLERMDIASSLEHVLPLRETADAATYIDIFRNNIPADIIGTGFAHTAALTSEGRVLSAGDNSFGQCETDGWSDIVSIAVGGSFTVGLKSDGTVVATGDNSYGQLDIVTAGKAKAIYAGNTCCAALLNTGNIVVYGSAELKETAGWSDICRFSLGAYSAAGVDSSGQVHSTMGTVSFDRPVYKLHLGLASWLAVYSDGKVGSSFGFEAKDALYADLGTRYAAVLNRDGALKIHSLRDGDRGIDAAENWGDLIAVSCRASHIAAVHADGTVSAAGENPDGRCDVTDWDLF